MTRLATLVALLLTTASAHERGDARLKLALRADDVIGVVLDVDARDIAQLAGWTPEAAHDASGFDRALLDYAQEHLSTWLEIRADRRLCPTEPDLTKPRSTRAVRVLAVVRCAGEPNHLAIRWRAQAHGLTLGASGQIVRPDGEIHAFSFDAADSEIGVHLRHPTSWLPLLMGALAAVPAALWWRRRRAKA